MKEKTINLSGRFIKSEVSTTYPFSYCIPVYHTVSNDDLPHIKHLIAYKNVKEFEKDLDQFGKNFQFVNWDEFKDFQNGNFKPGKKIALLTFDDGLSEFYHVVAPILERKGIYAMNFINPKFINNKELMFRCKGSLLQEKFLKNEKNKVIQKNFIQKIKEVRFKNQSILDEFSTELEVDFSEFLKTEKPYLTLEQLKSLKQKGFGISNHGWDHPLYHELTLKEQLENSIKSFDFLKENDFLTESFAFPFTDFGVKKEFFDEFFSEMNLFCSFGSAGLKLDDFQKNIQRIPMENGKDANRILEEEITYFKLKKLLNKNTIHRK